MNKHEIKIKSLHRKIKSLQIKLDTEEAIGSDLLQTNRNLINDNARLKGYLERTNRAIANKFLSENT